MRDDIDYRELLRIAWPAALASMVRGLYRLNDQFFVQDLGVEAQAAVAVGGMVAYLFSAFGELVGVGTLAIAVRRLGEGDEARAHAAIRTGLRTAFVIGCVLAIGTLSLGPALAGVLVPGRESAVERGLLIDYLRWIGIGQVTLASMPVVGSSFIALRRPRTQLGLELSGVATNTLFNALLVPAMGVEGAGLATALSRIPSWIAALMLLRSRGVQRPLFGAGAAGTTSRILRIGWPTCLCVLLYSAVYQTMLAWTFPHFGAEGRAALGPGFSIEVTFYCAYFGIGYAAGSLTGHALGEGRPERAMAIGRRAAKLNTVVALTSGLVFWIAGPAMVSLFAEDPRAIESCLGYLHWMSWAQAFQALQITFDQCLVGAGVTLPVMISSSTMNILRVPLAQLLAVVLDLGLRGVWITIDVTAGGRALWAWLRFRRGHWLRSRV